MPDKLWLKVVLLFFALYGPFLIIQSFINVWPTEQMHSIALFIGGIAMVLWLSRYWVKRPRLLVAAINAYVIAVIIGCCIGMPTLVILAKIQ